MSSSQSNSFALLTLISLLGAADVSQAQVPQILNYQGRVSVNGTNFDGTGAFQFALVNGTGAVTYWSNGNSVVSLPVSAGLYSVLLGDTTVVNMAAIPASVFTNGDVRLGGGGGLTTNDVWYSQSTPNTLGSYYLFQKQ